MSSAEAHRPRATRRARSQEPAAGTATALQVRGLTAGYSRSPVIEGVDFEVHNGQVVLLVGPNGAGKSTLLKAVVGVIPKLAGRVAVFARDVTGCGPAELTRYGVAYVPQQDDLFLPLSVYENLLLGGYLLSRRERRQRAEERLDGFPALAAARSRTAGTLSGGQRKTLALARALMLDPHVVILDEPTAGLAPRVAAQVLEETVGPLSKAGKAVLMVEQRVADALRVADQVEVLATGRIVLSETATAFGRRDDAGRWLMGATTQQESEQLRAQQ